MDPLDEFEFKPLTDGLGFHKKAVKLGDAVKGTELVEMGALNQLPPVPPAAMMNEAQRRDSNDDPYSRDDHRKALENLLSSLNAPSRTFEKRGIKITEPLPREEKPHRALDIGLNIETDIFSPPPVAKKTAPTVGARRGAANAPTGPRLVAESVSLVSAFLDAVVVFAASLIFLIALLMVTGIDLAAVLVSSKTDRLTQISLSVLYLAVMEMYVIVARSFFGCTLGEWTFDYQLGNDAEIQRWTYPLKVLWRSLVIMLTGFVVLPLLSLLFRKDLASTLSGLQLYRRTFSFG